jgi:hypothetical protein
MTTRRQRKNDHQEIDPHRLLDRYKEGDLTATGLIIGVLNLGTEGYIREALKILPPSTVNQLRHFVSYYGPDTRVFNGPRPDMKNVLLVRKLLKNFEGTEPSRPPQKRVMRQSETRKGQRKTES